MYDKWWEPGFLLECKVADKHGKGTRMTRNHGNGLQLKILLCTHNCFKICKDRHVEIIIDMCLYMA